MKTISRPVIYVALVTCLSVSDAGSGTAADSRFAHSDSNARFLHHIDLYDANNRQIKPDSDRPYSPHKTCGRCHDYETISHGWHFNAFMADAAAGRPGEPWIWTDARTGTQLPLSYRPWSHTFDPQRVGISAWEMTRHFGGRLPGGGLGVQPKEEPNDPKAADPAGGEGDQAEADSQVVNRWPFSGSLEIDCMACHAASGQYDFNSRRQQIDMENFSWAPTAALRLGTIDGNVSRIKDDADPEDEATQERIPKVTYDPSRFAADGTVFMDLVRQPESNACYQCHSQRTVTDAGIEARWIHDEDVHLRAGMDCADCHRNGIDHHIVRGYDGEENPSEQEVVTLSCAGCHLGANHADPDGEISEDIYARAGRLGSPKPAHAGLPPLHFEKLSCTACHGGPVPREEALRVMTSLAHGLGSKDHRSGKELPAIIGPVFTKQDDGRVYPHRSMWPSYWAVMEGEELQPIAPENVYDITRKALRVRRDFVEEVMQQKVSSKDLRELLGEERGKVDPEQWTEDEKAKVNQFQTAQGRTRFNEKVSAALEAIEQELNVQRAVYVSSGVVYARDEKPDSIKTIPLEDTSAIEMISWPMAHNVRSAGWSLGVGGCVECHSETGKIFASTVSPVGPGPNVSETTSMAALQGVRADQRLAWNDLFQGRKYFKYVIAGSVAILIMTLMIGIGAIASRLAGQNAA